MVLLLLVAVLLNACIGPFAGRRKAPWLGEAPRLQVRFDSQTASAQLSWEKAVERDFIHYEVQRSEGGDFAVLDRVDAVEDTAFVDEGLEADVRYGYRVVSYFSEGKTVHPLTSATAEGGFHGYVNAWDLEEEFLPTRLAINTKGVVFAVGAGYGRVERFDRAGHSLGGLVYTQEKLACMETSTLDGPVLALDEGDHLYVAYNLRQAKGGPQGWWSKFDAQGRLLWTRPLEGLFARHIVVDDGEVFIESISQLQQFDANGERQTQYLIPALLVSSLRLWNGRFAALIESLALRESDWQAPRLVIYQDARRLATSQVIGRDPKSPQDRGNGLLLRPTDFAVDEETERAFVVNAGRGRIEVFRHGHFLTRWGREGTGEGQFRFAGSLEVVEDMATGAVAQQMVVAGGIARDRDGYIYVADTFNNRIQKFQP